MHVMLPSVQLHTVGMLELLQLKGMKDLKWWARDVVLPIIHFLYSVLFLPQRRMGCPLTSPSVGFLDSILFAHGVPNSS